MLATDTLPPFGPPVAGETRPKLSQHSAKRTGHIYRDCQAVDIVVKKGRKVTPCDICMADARDIGDRARLAQQDFDRRWLAEHNIKAVTAAAAETVSQSFEPRSIPVESDAPVLASAAQVRLLMHLYKIDQPNATYVAIKNAELRAQRMTKAKAIATITALKRKHNLA